MVRLLKNATQIIVSGDEQMSDAEGRVRAVRLPVVKVFVCLLAMSAALVVIGLAVQVARFTGDVPPSLVVAFDLNGERNVPALYSGALLALNAVLCLLTASTARQSSRRWYGLAAVAGFLSIDELLSIHERFNPVVLSVADGFFPDTMPFVWMFAYAPPCVLLAWTYRSFLQSLDERVARLLVLAAVVYVGGAVGFEILEGRLVFLLGTSDTLQRSIVVAIEEMLELTGACLSILAILRHLSGRSAPLTIVID